MFNESFPLIQWTLLIVLKKSGEVRNAINTSFVTKYCSSIIVSLPMELKISTITFKFSSLWAILHNYAANSKHISIKECGCHCSLVYSVGYFCLSYVGIFVLIRYSSLLSLPMLNGILLLEERNEILSTSWVRRNLSRILWMLYFWLLFELGPENTSWKIRIMLNCHYSQTIINKVP